MPAVELTPAEADTLIALRTGAAKVVLTDVDAPLPKEQIIYDEGGTALGSVERRQSDYDFIRERLQSFFNEAAMDDAASGFDGSRGAAIAWMMEKATLVAREAANRSFEQGIKVGLENNTKVSRKECLTLEELRSGISVVLPKPSNGGYLALSDDEIALIKGLRKPGELRPLEASVVETFGTGQITELTDPLVAYLDRQWAWSLRTFGPGFRTNGVINHCRKELGEIEKKPFDLEEWIDLIILALDGFWRHGGSAIRLLPLLQFKQDKNFARNWPNWRERSEDQAIEHDRSGEKTDVAA